MLNRLIHVGAWALVIGFLAYVVVTHPSMAADAVHAAWAGVVKAGNAVATFLDALLK